MKVAVTGSGPTLESAVDPRFGRAQYFVLVDTDSMTFEAVENPAIQAAGGAGIQAAQLVAAAQVQAVLTGNVGPNAYQALSAAGVKVYPGASGTIGSAVDAFLKGALQEAAAPSVGSHFGSGVAQG